MQKKPSPKEEQEHLVVVRDHLIKLSSVQTQLQRCQDAGRDSPEVSVFEVVTIWQQLFKETFLQYYRLSTHLIKNEDVSAVLKLWEDYLKHVEGFLATTIPHTYSGLTDDRHICEVHENLLNNQKDVFEKNIKPEIASKFRYLITVHNDILVQLRNRHDDLSNRIQMWDKYNSMQDEVLEWIKRMEQTRSSVQLHYLNLKRVPKMRLKIEELLNQIPDGEVKSLRLGELEKDILSYCDEGLGSALKNSHGAMDRRISNLKAALQTWLDYINRITQLENRYNAGVKTIQEKLTDGHATYATMCQRNLITEPNSNRIIEDLQKKKLQIVNIAVDLQQSRDTLEELKERISPYDLKSMRQIVCLLGHQRDDLEQQYSCLINDCINKLSLWSVFNERYTYLIGWTEGLKRRIQSSYSELAYVNHSDDVQRFIEKEIKTEMALKERDRDWIVSSGKQLLTIFSEANKPEQLCDIQYKLNNVLEQWEHLMAFTKSRSNELADMKTTIMKLEIRIAELRSWLFTMEKEFASPIHFEGLDEQSYKAALKVVDNLHRRIEKESSNFGEVMNLCEMLFSDVNTWKSHFNMSALSLAIDNIEQRWKHLCHLSTDRKRQIMSIWMMFQDIQKIYCENSSWLDEQQTAIASLKPPTEFNRATVPLYLEQVAAVMREMQSREKIFLHLENSYRQLFIIDILESSNMLHIFQHVKQMLYTWHTLYETLIRRFEIEMSLFTKFLDLHESAVLRLTQIDAIWTEIEISQLHETVRTRKLRDITDQLQSLDDLIKLADETGAEIQNIYTDGAVIQSLMDEYHQLYFNIRQRLDNDGRAEVVEHDLSVQVKSLTSITPKDAYLMELKAALKEAESHLSTLEQELDKIKLGAFAKPNKVISACESSIELIQHLHSILKTECHCTSEECHEADVERLSEKFRELLGIWKATEKTEQDKK